MAHQKPPVRRAILAAGAMISATRVGVLFATPPDAAPTITFTGGDPFSWAA